MIRFIDLGTQICHPDDDDPIPEFAFYDTVTDRFLEIEGTQTWASWNDFEDDYDEYVNYKFYPLERFKSLVHDKYKDG